MTDRPERPPRPDEEDLVRFHNGDTLDNIPIVCPPASTPQQRRSWLGLGALAVLVAVIGALAGVGAVQLAGGREPRTDARPPASPSVAASTVASTSASPSSAATGSPTASESVEAASQPQFEQVRIIQAPATGGDPSTSYCLVYTGSDSGGVKEAILLANAAAYQCADLLPYDPEGAGTFSTEAPSCEPPARAAVLSFAEGSEWAGAVYFTCLIQHTGA